MRAAEGRGELTKGLYRSLAAQIGRGNIDCNAEGSSEERLTIAEAAHRSGQSRAIMSERVVASEETAPYGSLKQRIAGVAPGSEIIPGDGGEMCLLTADGIVDM